MPTSPLDRYIETRCPYGVDLTVQASRSDSRRYTRLPLWTGLLASPDNGNGHCGDDGRVHWYGSFPLPPVTQNNTLKARAIQVGRGKWTATTYDDPRIEKWQEQVRRDYIGDFPHLPLFFSDPVETFVAFYDKPPRADIDGYLKKTHDILQGYAYHDDSQIVKSTLFKLVASEYQFEGHAIHPHVEVLVRRMVL